MSTPHLYAIIAGVGPGTGAAIAKKFAASYSLVMLARTVENLKPIAQEIQDRGGKAICVEADVSNPASMEKALRVVDEQLGEQSQCAVSFHPLTLPSTPNQFLV